MGSSRSLLVLVGCFCFASMASAIGADGSSRQPPQQRDALATRALEEFYCYYDFTQPGCQSCFVESEYPDCVDPTCTAAICDDEANSDLGCCTTAWTSECTTLAVTSCNPNEVIPM